MLKYENKMLILGKNYILYAPNTVNFSVWYLQVTAWIFNYLVASHVTEQGSLPT